MRCRFLACGAGAVQGAVQIISAPISTIPATVGRSFRCGLCWWRTGGSLPRGRHPCGHACLWLWGRRRTFSARIRWRFSCGSRCGLPPRSGRAAQGISRPPLFGRQLFEGANAAHWQEQATFPPYRDGFAHRTVVRLHDFKDAQIRVRLFVLLGRGAFEVEPRADAGVPCR
jgi:hypothetical protein